LQIKMIRRGTGCNYTWVIEDEYYICLLTSRIVSFI